MFQHILVPLDGSSRAEQALPIAARIARVTGGMVHLIRVVSPSIDYSSGLSPVSLASGEMIESEMTEATAYLRRQTASSLLQGIKTRGEAILGQPVSSLLEAIKTEGIDLLVLCSHGRSGFPRWILGSVARRLVHHAPIPTLVLRQNEASAALVQADPASPFRTLVPLDGSPLAEAALAPAAFITSALAAPGQGTLHLSQVVKVFPTTAAEGFVSEFNEDAIQRARTYLGHMEERLHSEMRDLKLSITHSVELNSDVASALENVAEHGSGEEIGASHLITISTHGRGGLERWLMGSITERLLTVTNLPLLVVRPLEHK